MILVTGATGHLGKLTIDFLLTKQPASSIAALVRDPAKTADLQAQGVDLRTGDYTDYPSLVRAFAGIDTLLLVSSGSLENRVEQHINAINAAKEAGVTHIAYTSVVAAQENMKFLPGPDHFHTEAYLKASGISYTILRNTFYTDVLPELLGPALSSGQWYYPGGQAKANFAARTDMAEALARVGLDPSAHRNQTYEITGSRAYRFEEIAAALSEVAGKPVAYIPIPLAAYGPALEGAGVPAPAIPIVVSIAESLAAGELSLVDPALANLLGREPEELKTTLTKLMATQPVA